MELTFGVGGISYAQATETGCPPASPIKRDALKVLSFESHEKGISANACQIARLDAYLPLAGTRCSASHYGSLRRLGIGAANKNTSDKKDSCP